MFHITQQVKNVIKGEARKKIQKEATLNEKGAEVLDPQPLFLDAGFIPQETQTDKIRRITLQIQQETAAKFAAQNMTEEQIQRILDEEDDFEIPEDFENTLTQYEARSALTQLEDNFYLQEEQTPPRPVDELIDPSEAPKEGVA